MKPVFIGLIIGLFSSFLRHESCDPFCFGITATDPFDFRS